MEILNKSCGETLEIKKNNPLGFVVIEPENLKFKHETTKNKRKKTLLSKTTQYKPKTQKTTWRFLNRYDFAYAGRDTVNQAAKVAPGVIKAATNDINNIAEQKIN